MLGLPERELLRISEVADYFSVTDRCIRLWIEHKHLDMVRIVGSIRVTRASVLKCRFKHFRIAYKIKRDETHGI